MFFLKDLPSDDMIARVGAGLDIDPSRIRDRLGALRAASVLMRRIEQYLAMHGLSQTQFLVLMVIEREPARDSLQSSEIAARLDISRPVLSKTLATMERSGLIRRQGDGRRAPIAPTETGRARFDALLPGYFALLDPGPDAQNDP
ncbi:MarR family winged helix-turn-helix transcriptional regulator [Roseobacter sp. HKCCA0434]|uniref:MarR family winged helix-turn-helix transcriptional regulator n=1 Tax=Roseobacter sp. HKCCA0434 TaxID=3079297 RepID=UPI002905B3E7|nr:MarR family transcriptional regulator [Roseobacter sp. HKCCA0434]